MTHTHNTQHTHQTQTEAPQLPNLNHEFGALVAGEHGDKHLGALHCAHRAAGRQRGGMPHLPQPRRCRLPACRLHPSGAGACHGPSRGAAAENRQLHAPPAAAAAPEAPFLFRMAFISAWHTYGYLVSSGSPRLDFLAQGSCGVGWGVAGWGCRFVCWREVGRCLRVCVCLGTRVWTTQPNQLPSQLASRAADARAAGPRGLRRTLESGQPRGKPL